MIHQQHDFDLDAAVKRQEEKKGGLIVHCGHTKWFWETGKTVAQLGDIIACSRCSQYFVKCGDLPWIVKATGSRAHAAMGIDVTFPSRTNHIACECYVPVNLRITD